MGIKKKIRNFPEACGVYIMKDISNKILYIGKARSLKKRVSQYFQTKKTHSLKIHSMVSKVKDVDYILANSEQQALLLEANLIKKHKPVYNIELRDDKSYPFIEITNEEFPRVSIVRPKQKDNSYYYGPYTNVRLLRSALKSIRHIFNFCTCKRPDEKCLYYKLKLCPGPYQSKSDKIRYKRNIKNLKLFLEGRHLKLIDRLSQTMLRYAKEKKFEEAAKLRDQIQALSSLIQDYNYRGLQELKKIFALSNIPKRIEAFDISNIYGRQATGSMVCFIGAEPYKNNYRRFRIKTFEGIDDYKMLKEVLHRRYQRVLKEALQRPDLILIDGGKGHLNVAKDALSYLGLSIPIISIAKQKETIYSLNSPKPIKMRPNSAGLHLLQRIRDEAHRFAIKYHHLLRTKTLINER